MALALTYVPDIVAKERVAAVLGLVLAGFSVSSVVGVPIGTALAGPFGWKAAYACVFALGLAVSVALLPTLPRGSSAHAASATPTLRTQLRLLGDARVLGAIAMILAGAASTYVFYTYLTPVLADVVGLSVVQHEGQQRRVAQELSGTGGVVESGPQQQGPGRGAVPGG